MLRFTELVEIVRAQEEKFNYLLQSQFVRLCFIVAGIAGIYIIQMQWPELTYRYPYLSITSHFWLDVLRFWPAFVFAVVVNIVAMHFDTPLPDIFDERFYSQNVVVSIGAGLTEEGWFRGVGPFYYGLFVMGLNFALESPVGIGVAGAAGVLGLLAGMLLVSPPRVENEPPHARINRLVTFSACALVVFAYVAFPAHPISTLAERVFYPIINTLSFGLMSHVLPGSFPSLLVTGMLFANFAFRDGHKYQGWFGWSMSWWLGCVFIFATLTYGLFVAMAVHAIFDAAVATLIYVGQKLKPEPILIGMRE